MDAKDALDLAVRRHCQDEEQSEDIIFATVSSSITVDSLQCGDEVEVSRFSLSRPRVSWRVKLQVEGGEVLRVVLCEVAAEDMACLRVQGAIHIRQRVGGGDEEDGCVPDVQDHDEEYRLHAVIVVDGSATIASVHMSTVSEMKVVMSTFYFQSDFLREYQDLRVEETDSDGKDGEPSEAKKKDAHLQLLGSMSADLGHLLATQEGADVTLVVNKVPVRAHRAVLIARSHVFRHLLQTSEDAEQSEQRVVEVSDAPRDAFMKVLDFMYTADASGLAGREMDVLVLAVRYGLADLADVCCRRLLHALDRDNTKALDMLAFAELHGVAALKERALLVVVEHLAEVTASPQWRECKQRMPSLAADLLETAAIVLQKPRPS